MLGTLGPVNLPLALQRLTSSAILAALALALFESPAATANAGRDGLIAYEGLDSAAGYLYIRDAAGGHPRRLRVARRPSDPSLSPLGRRIAFSDSGRLWTVYLDGSVLHQVTSDAIRARSPAWAPEGDALAFAGGPAGAQDIYVVGADGGGLRRLTFKSADETTPTWSSRNLIAFVRRDRRGDGDIFTLSARGGRSTRLTRGAADDRQPAWSPDGRLIAFTRKRRAVRNVYLMRADGSKLRRLTRLSHAAASPAWSPDGQSLAFASGSAHGRRALFIIRRDGRRMRRLGSSRSDPRALDWRATDLDPVVAAAGDIACDPASAYFNRGFGTRTRCGSLETSNALLKMDLTSVFALGDVQYEDGQFGSFLASFAPTWGRLKPLIRPVLGNHEYGVAGAAGYFDYFNGADTSDGPAGRRGAGYYSFDLGRWHVVALNSACGGPEPPASAPSCALGSPQESWLRKDLAAHPVECTLAVLHHPLVSSGVIGVNPSAPPLWQALVDAGVDVALTGHDHAYERFSPIDATGAREPARGVREFVVGTGGKDLRRRRWYAPNSELRRRNAFGVLQLTLKPRGYSWRFVNVGSGRSTDAGSRACR